MPTGGTLVFAVNSLFYLNQVLSHDRSLKVCFGFFWFVLVWLFDLIWSDLIWFDLIWSDLIWFDLIWSDLIWFDLIWSDWSDLIWFDMIWTDLIWFDLIGLIWSDLIWFELIWSDLIWFDLIWSDLIWFEWHWIFKLIWSRVTHKGWDLQYVLFLSFCTMSRGLRFYSMMKT